MIKHIERWQADVSKLKNVQSRDKIKKDEK
jgi:hypothetical protein